MKKWHKLAKLQHDAESRIFPDGLAKKEAVFSEAQQEVKDYFQRTYELQEE